MTHDDNIAYLLRSEARYLAKQAEELRTDGGGHPQTEMTRMLNRKAAEHEAQVDRMNELAEALAGGKLRIVDEYLAVKMLELEFQRDRDREPGDEAEATHYSPLRVAQLALTALNEKGALR